MKLSISLSTLLLVLPAIVAASGPLDMRAIDDLSYFPGNHARSVGRQFGRQRNGGQQAQQQQAGNKQAAAAAGQKQGQAQAQAQAAGQKQGQQAAAGAANNQTGAATAGGKQQQAAASAAAANKGKQGQAAAAAAAAAAKSSSAAAAAAASNTAAAAAANGKNNKGGKNNNAAAAAAASSSAAAAAASSSSAAAAAATATATAAANGKNNKGGKNNNNAAAAASSSSAAAAAAASSSSAAAAATASATAAANGKNNKGGKNNNAAASSSSAAAAASSSSSAAAAASSSAAAKANDNNPDTSLTLLQELVATNLAQDGQATAEAGQVPSLTSTNNFINFCSGKTITNGQQITTGSCNPIPMGDIVPKANMPASKFKFPKNFSTIPANKAFTIQMNLNNLQAGVFTNAQKTYYMAPQQLNGQKILIGHTHFVIQPMGNFDDPSILDPAKFTFFKGINTAAVNGVVSADVTAGVPAGNYRLASINTDSNHAPAIVAVAQHGFVDDMIYFTAK